MGKKHGKAHFSAHFAGTALPGEQARTAPFLLSTITHRPPDAEAGGAAAAALL